MIGLAEALPLPSSVADAVVCLCAIEHISSPEKALAEVARILKPGGMLVITADSMASVISNDVRIRHQSMYHVYRYFDVKSLLAVIEGAGLHVEIAFPILCSADAIRELERSMEDPTPCGPLRTRRLLVGLRKGDGAITSRTEGLFVFAVAKRLV
jgi:SAM-dependent methyltransferase